MLLASLTMECAVYNEFFGFERAPFNNTPDPAFFYASPSHQEALATMVYGVEQGKGFVMLTGDVGMGKTLLRQTLKQELGERCVVIEIENPWSSPEEVLSAIRLCVNAPGTENNALFDGLRERLLGFTQQGRRVVLIIDEAHQMSERMIEGIRLLSNVETTTEKLLQIIFIGQNELAEMLGRYSMRQIQQRLYLSQHLESFDLQNTMGYVRHRLTVAGGSPVLFDPAALQLLHRESQGTPRVINQLCDSALLYAMGRDSHRVAVSDMREAVSALRRWRKPESSVPEQPPTNESKEVPAENVPEVPSTDPDSNGGRLPFQLPPPGRASNRASYAQTAAVGGLPFSLPIDGEPTAQAELTAERPAIALPRLSASYKQPVMFAVALLIGAGVAWYFAQPTRSAAPAALVNSQPAVEPGDASASSPSGMTISPSLSMAMSVGGGAAAAPAPNQPVAAVQPNRSAPSAAPGEIRLPEIANVRVMTVPKDGGVARLGSELFGLWNESARDLLAVANPDTRGRIDDLSGGSLIKVPALKREGLISQAANGSYYIYYGAFPGQDEAQMELNAVKRLWAGSQLVPDKARSPAIYRVFVGAFASRAEAVTALDSLWFKHLPALN